MFVCQVCEACVFQKLVSWTPAHMYTRVAIGVGLNPNRCLSDSHSVLPFLAPLRGPIPVKQHTKTQGRIKVCEVFNHVSSHTCPHRTSLLLFQLGTVEFSY